MLYLIFLNVIIIVFLILIPLQKAFGNGGHLEFNLESTIISHSCFIHVCLQLLNNPGSLFLYFSLCTAPHIFMGDRSGLQAGQSSTHTLFLRSITVVTRAACGLYINATPSKLISACCSLFTFVCHSTLCRMFHCRSIQLNSDLWLLIMPKIL